jgi:hypothetical protein
MRMKNSTFNELYQQHVSLQTVKEYFVEYVYQRYCKAFHLHSNAEFIAIEKTAIRLQIDKNDVHQILLKL